VLTAFKGANFKMQQDTRQQLLGDDDKLYSQDEQL
jgi:hypothetical protein